jgi:hypothetical protein
MQIGPGLAAKMGTCRRINLEVPAKKIADRTDL